MLSNHKENDRKILVHIVYDKVNGHIIGQYRHFDLMQNAYCECDSEEALASFKDDESVLARITDGDVHNLAVLSALLSDLLHIEKMYVSSKRQALVPLPHLQLRADRDVLEGNGRDSLTLYIDVVDEQGKVNRDYQGEIHVSTSRGKLSTRGGQVKIKDGQGKANLKSVAETVDQVRVRARTKNNSAVAGEILLRFE